MTYPHAEFDVSRETLAGESATAAMLTLIVKVYAHRFDVPMADKITHEVLEVQRGGMRKTFDDWVSLHTFSMSRMMNHDGSISAVTITCTDGSGNILVGIRKIKVPEQQIPLEF